MTLAIILPGSSRRGAGRAERRDLPERQAARPAEPTAVEGELSLTISDFLLPEAPAPAKAPPYYLFRQRLPRWSKEQVERYWIPPRDVAADVLRKVNDATMEKFFEQIP